MMCRRISRGLVASIAVAALATACGGNPPPVARPVPAPETPSAGSAAVRPPEPPEPVDQPITVPEEPPIASASLDTLNRSSPLKPVFFALDSVEVTPEYQRVLQQNAAVLEEHGTWTVTIEGHCDETGSAEYNLALGERRAVAARTYLISLGVAADRLRTVSYGKEYPFDPGHDEAAMARNRRAHFVITANEPNKSNQP